MMAMNLPPMMSEISTDTLSVVFLLCCPVLCFYGHQLVDALLGLLTGLLAAMVAYQLLTERGVDATLGVERFWIAVAVVGLIGCLLGRFVKRLAFVLVGSALGWLLAPAASAFVVEQLAAQGIHVSEGQVPILQYGVFGAMALACICIVQCLEFEIAILMTSVTGAYLGVAGADHILFKGSFCGHECFWPGAILGVEVAADHRSAAIQAQIICGRQLLAWFALTVLGVVVQYRHLRAKRVQARTLDVYEPLPSA